MEEDAVVKKNTDCVYFLASPLTCKKGNDCEFRHSESARVNPRDCRYWLSGNCLNWDCPFRHPPLEGRPVIAAAAAPGPGGGNKARVPCYFFSQGFCAKGDKCPFMHGNPSIQNLKAAALQRPVKVLPSSVPEENEKQRDAPASNGAEAKSVKVSTVEAHVPTEVIPALVSGVQSNQKDGRTVSGATQNGGQRGRAEGPVVNSGVVASRLRLRHVQPGDDRVQNGMEPDEWWEESSPGFDVLVDDGPEQSRYPDDPEFQSAGETGLDSGNVGVGNRERGGRSRRMGDEIDPYDYDFPNMYDHTTNYEAGVPYDHGAYEYNVHKQQGGYELPSGYERSGHHRLSAYSERESADEMIVRERMGLPMDVDMRSGGGGGARDQRTRIVKRRRADGGQHVPDSHARRQRTEIPDEEYQHHQRQQEDQQKQHELHLRQQLFMQHGMRNNSRRGQEKSGVEPGVIARRALYDIGASEGQSHGLERVPQKTLTRGRSNEHTKSGVKEVDIHSRLSRAVDVHGEAESRTYVDVDGSRKVEKETKRDPSTFAGPKSLAQIRAEKKKILVEEPAKFGEALNGLKKPVQSKSQSKVHAVRSQPHPAPDVASLESLSVEERKIKQLDKVATQELKKVPNFEGPKSLSAILKEKRKVEPGTDSQMEETNVNHLQRLSPPASRVGVTSRVEAFPDEESQIPNVDTEVGPNVGYADVEDGEFLSDDDEGQKYSEHEKNEKRHGHTLAMEADGSQNVELRNSLWQEDSAVAQLDDSGRGLEKEELVEGSNGAGREKIGEDVDYNEGPEYDGEDREEDVEPEHDDEGYGIDEDDDEDDFAKKLGGFFP